MKLIGIGKLVKRLTKVDRKTKPAVEFSMMRACEYLRGWIVSKKLSGQVLKVDTNLLRGSIKKEVFSDMRETIGRVGTNLIYARMHEFGKTRSGSRVIVPTKAKVLHFFLKDGTEIFTRAVHIVERPYIRPSVKESKKKLFRILGRSFAEEVGIAR